MTSVTTDSLNTTNPSGVRVYPVNYKEKERCDIVKAKPAPDDGE